MCSMKIKFKKIKHQTSIKTEKLLTARKKKDGMQFELTPSAVNYWEGGKHGKEINKEEKQPHI